MPTPGQELASIDFESMIGGPLVAVIDAQAQAAMSTVNFIKNVGFKTTEQDDFGDGDSGVGEPIYVSFTYPKEVQPYQPAIPEDKEKGVKAQDAVPAVWDEMKLTVPLLTMVPIPFIRVEEASVEFNAKINSVQTRDTDSTVKVDAEFEGRAKTWFYSARLKVNTSYQKSTQTGSKVDRTYSLQVKVRATQDEMPAGMERILGILEDAIKSEPASLGSGKGKSKPKPGN